MDDNVFLEENIEHSGVKRRSGRYDWGSGEIPYQHEPWFQWMTDVDKYREQGLSETEIAKAFGMSTTEYRKTQTIYKNQRSAAESAFVYRLKEKGYSNTSIAKRMNISEGKVRNMLTEHYNVRAEKMENIQNVLKDSVEKNKYIDVGDGTEIYMNIKKTQLTAALKELEQQGYTVDNIYIEQATNPGKKTTVKVLAKEGTTKQELYENSDKISFVGERLADDGLERSKLGLMKPEALNSDRLMIRYAEEGGKDKDGVIELRKGVSDISLGDSRYAQVRINVDDSHYLKGMAIYSDNMPDGVDVIFNTNKHQGTDMEKVLKPLKRKDPNDPNSPVDWDNPFGSAIKESVKNESGLLIGGQREYVDDKGNKKLSLINKVNEEGDWGEWKKTLASQMLSKQSKALAKDQLNIAYLEKRADLDDILSLTNSQVKKKLLQSFADDCDVAASELRGAALPRQASKVILPLTSIKDNEIFAPGYKDGETVVLIRYPHGGKFEIPELTVNNKNKEGRSILTLSAKDAVGISSKVAEKLSGADFDGDTVLVIPNNEGRIKTSPSLKGLKDFDPKEAYPAYEGMKRMTSTQTQNEMGKVSNLITDMTIKGAKPEEIAKAVRHSMVVIDAEKHNLNWKQSEKDNEIAHLKELYQGGANRGASTLISKAGSEERVDERYDRYKIDPKTGKRIYTETGRTYIKTKKNPDGTYSPVLDKNGNPVEIKYKTTITKMDTVEDANKLSSGTEMEKVYANHANQLKAMANEARKALIGTETYKRSPSAAKTYEQEVKELDASLAIALKNRPLERKAQLIANSVIKAKIAENPDLKLKENSKQLKKIRQQAINEARRRMGSTRRSDREIPITPKQWEAIQARAISPTKLATILDNTNPDTIRAYATPKDRPTMTDSKIAMAKAMLSSGNSVGDIADRLGVSTATLYNYLD